VGAPREPVKFAGVSIIPHMSIHARKCITVGRIVLIKIF
jgi:hypothetical protein